MQILGKPSETRPSYPGHGFCETCINILFAGPSPFRCPTCRKCIKREDGHHIFLNLHRSLTQPTTQSTRRAPDVDNGLTLFDDMDSIIARVPSLRKKMYGYGTEVSRLQHQLEQLQHQVSVTREKHDTLKVNHQALRLEHADLRSCCTNLESQHNKAQRTSMNFQKKHEAAASDAQQWRESCMKAQADARAARKATKARDEVISGLVDMEIESQRRAHRNKVAGVRSFLVIDGDVRKLVHALDDDDHEAEVRHRLGVDFTSEWNFERIIEIESPCSYYIDMSDDQTELTSILTQLFEHSDILINKLIPELLHSIQDTPLDTTDRSNALIDRAIAIIHAWNADDQAQFIIGHPRIGENKQLSALSAKEQSGGLSATARVETPPEVLERLGHLNACYEHVYFGLRYITFVDGRSRAAIATEMEDKLQLGHPLESYPNGPPLNEPAPESLSCVMKGSEEWSNELGRAVDDVGRIAKSRQKTVLSNSRRNV
ncbi:hypothetical protein AZE42_01468 [Rhizopogon vesiculosus]|uniref:Oxo-4-hydroxy-4-carboxy-5-ureidoimidazoline decarboxylase domain-containing protein n=1 Tax=Rhizopogon vesiculosus TaxID=180088 RepID=A0A1J8QJY8_9AGAM|nr:hypothetical protein AZE42_01468 [Rhizopogon vesiculosus]